MRAPWWTAADEAEVAVLVAEFVALVGEHRDGCSTCSSGGAYCDGLRGAWAVVEDFKRRRELHSEALFLRVRQTLVDLERALAA